MRYLFENYIFDTDRRELRRGAEMIPLAPQVFDLLAYLIRNRERVVSKDDLIRAIWNGRAVSDAALTTRLNVARGAVGDTGEEQRLIKTLPRKGFRFVGGVEEDRQGSVPPGGHTIVEAPSCAPRLSIVVLPFVNISADPEQDYFVDGVTESLTTDLSRIHGSCVIGRHTAFSYKGKAVDLKQVGRELNVRYALEGSVQRGGNRLRVNVQLVDAETGAHLWADRFDKPAADLFAIQDEIISRLANSLDAQLVAAEAMRAQRSAHPNSLELYFQGRAKLNMGLTSEYILQARHFFERALTVDPDNIEARLGLAHVDGIVGAGYMTDNRMKYLTVAEAAVMQVLTLAPNHALAHLHLGTAKIFTNRVSEGIEELQHALALDRNLAHAHGLIGQAKIFLGRGGETEAHVLEALRLSPRDIHAFMWMQYVGFAKLQLSADREAVSWLRRSIDANRNYPFAHFGLAAALALLGALDDARAAAQAGLALQPNFSIRRFRASPSTDNPAYLAKRERIYEGMRLAGVPEG
ncbi:winged helix-turn-helix domain-containing protein [Bradyrhizobium arachidis]|uniref:winged helix-turn-helix domain-containing tetratricopeptide repeat protein n=1 Tax=Bradyrhizobium arachidis TaxID=858423 RepID=UPI0021619E12|nr:winged helix-turn-helix domain-containing protein [Bradyrhizobium arachidis]UVO29712.1 winged helix-turn-helix domain-containing protein [Bradyrhizobium arachidis]